MRTRSRRFAGVVLLALLVPACDGNSETDADVFVGTWTLTNVLLDGQDVTALLLAQGAVEIGFEGAGTFEIRVETSTGVRVVAGTYALDEGRKTLTLTSADLVEPVTVSYEIVSDSRIRITSGDVRLLSELAGVDLGELGLDVETVELVVQRAG